MTVFKVQDSPHNLLQKMTGYLGLIASLAQEALLTVFDTLQKGQELLTGKILAALFFITGLQASAFCQLPAVARETPKSRAASIMVSRSSFLGS